jgi:signal transduction histidine kinase
MDRATRYAKYLLIWPLWQAYRRKLRQRVRWRLADSHLTAVWSSIIVLCVLLVIAIFVASWFTFPSGGEAPEEATAIVRMIDDVQKTRPMTNDQLSVLLAAISSGALTENISQNQSNIQATIGGEFQGIQSISIVAPNGLVAASTDPSFIGQQYAQVLPHSADLTKRALDTPGASGALWKQLGDGGAAVARFNGANSDLGVLVLEKSKLSFPNGKAITHAAVKLILQLGLIVLIGIGLPAIPVSIAIAVKRGKAIGKPIKDLAAAGERLANGELDSRVQVTGEDELARLQAGFNEMADHLQDAIKQESEQRARSDELLAANQELIANVSHELRTPVALIRGHLEAIESDPDDAGDYVRIAIRETDRLGRLVEDLFQLTRLESKRLDLDLAPFDPASAAREAVEALAEPARREAGILVRAESNTGESTCLGDRARFVQVLVNLIRNAIRYTPEGGIILVSTSGHANTIQVTVRDTGSGIPPEDLPHIFDRFYRADPSRNRGSGGAGLGLAIARELIEAMGGTIAVESTLDEGTVFTIEMPRAVSNAGAANGYSLAGSAAK